MIKNIEFQVGYNSFDNVYTSWKNGMKTDSL